MNKRGQYSLIVFVIASFVLLSLTGVVSELLVEQADQINKAQELMMFSDYVNGIKTIQYQERQLGIDTAGFYLGSLGIWPHGTSNCGSAVSLKPEDLLKSIPYWRSDSETADFYQYDGELYTDTSDYRVFSFHDVRDGLYALESDCPDNVSPFLLDGVFEFNNKLSLSNGDHLILIDNNSPVCEHTISCDNISPSNCKPTELKLKRIIPKGSKYENCIPSEELSVEFFQKILNEFFSKMNPLAYILINQQIKSPDGILRINFPEVIYQAQVEKVGFNAMFITFFPIKGQTFQVGYEGLTNTSYQGSTLVHNAFDNDFARFKTAAVEVMDEDLIDKLINGVLSSHSRVYVLDQVSVSGLANPAFESYLNSLGEDLNVNSYVNEVSNVEKPYCTYYLREVCQFMSKEVETGYELFNNFTSDEKRSIPWDVSDEIFKASCDACFADEKNSCSNIKSAVCLDCFKEALGKDFSSVSDSFCESKINEDIIPLLTDLINYRVNDIELLLKKRYGFDWRIDTSRLNITGINLVSEGVDFIEFKSSCDNCENIEYGNCEELKPDFSITDLNLDVNGCGLNDCGSIQGSVVTTGSNVPIKASGLINNLGNTFENSVRVRVFVDSYVNPSDENYDSCTNDYSRGICYDFEYSDSIIDLSTTIDPLSSISDDFGVVFHGNDMGLIGGAHKVFVCVESAYNDDFDLSNSCQEFDITLCGEENADEFPVCCPYVWFYGDLAQDSYYGPCCGDDNTPMETFFNDSSQELACAYNGPLPEWFNNGVCEPGPEQNCHSDPDDCLDCCGDGLCDIKLGENSISCPSDC